MKVNRPRHPVNLRKSQREALLDALEVAPVTTALAAVGLARSTHYDWLKRAEEMADGDDDEHGYQAYAEAVSEARASGQLRRLQELEGGVWGDERVRAQNLRYVCDVYLRSEDAKRRAEERKAQAEAAQSEIDLDMKRREAAHRWPKLEPIELDPDAGLTVASVTEAHIQELQALWRAREAAPTSRMAERLSRVMQTYQVMLLRLLSEGETGKANRLVEIPPEVLEIEETVVVNYDRDITSE